MTLKSTSARSKTKNKVRALVEKTILALLSLTQDTSVVAKPTVWNQGGYDVFFVERVAEQTKQIRLRFGQITKGKSHDLKGGFMYTVVQLFEEAGYMVDSVELAFILTQENMDSFALGKVEGADFLKQYKRFNSQEKWEENKIHDCISKYELAISARVVG